MKTNIMIFLLLLCVLAQAELPYKLPPKAKYDVSVDAIAAAKAELSTQLVANAAALTNLFVSPSLCGPGLWHILKDSPRFKKAPTAKTTARIPIGGGKFQEFPMALLQSPDEVSSFRKALADFLGSEGSLEVREPKQEEFMKFWEVYPFDNISGPILVADGKDACIFCQFQKGNVFWIDEIKRMHFNN